MKTISASNLNWTTLINLFVKNNQRAELVVVHPADINLGLEDDSYINIIYDEDKQVKFWINQNQKLLRMRAILLDKSGLNSINQESKKVGYEIDWNELIANENQNAEKFGTLNINALGLSLDYSLPYKEAILEESILLSLDNLIQGAKSARILIEMKVKRVQRKAKDSLQ